MTLGTRCLAAFFLYFVGVNSCDAQSPWVGIGFDSGPTVQLLAQNGTVAWATTNKTSVFSSDGAFRYALAGPRRLAFTAGGQLIDCVKQVGNQENRRFEIASRDAMGTIAWSATYDFPTSYRVLGGSCELSLTLADGSYVAQLALSVYNTEEQETLYQAIRLSATGVLLNTRYLILYAAHALSDGGFVPSPPSVVFNADLSTRFVLPPFAWRAVSPFADASILAGGLTILPSGIAPHVRRISPLGETIWQSPLGMDLPEYNQQVSFSNSVVNPISSVSSQVTDSLRGFTLVQRDELGNMLRQRDARGFNNFETGDIVSHYSVTRNSPIRTGPFRFMFVTRPVKDISNGLVEDKNSLIEVFESDGTIVQRPAPPLPLDGWIAVDQGTLFASASGNIFMRPTAERTKLRLSAPIDESVVDAGAVVAARAESDISDPLAPIEFRLGSSTCTTTVAAAECSLTAPNSIGAAPITARYPGSAAREPALTPPSIVKVRGTSDLAIRILGLPRFFAVAPTSPNAFTPINFTVEVREQTGADVQTTVRIRAPWWRGFARPNVTCPADLECQRVGILSSGDVFDFAVRLPPNATTLFRVDALVPPYELGLEAPVQTTEATIILNTVHTDPQLTNNAAQIITSLGIFASGFD